MTKGTLNEERFEAIEAYLLETMPLAERERFEQELASDADLRQEVDLMREHILAVELGGFTRAMRTAAEEGRGSDGKRGGGWPGWWRYAAAVAILTAVALWFLLDREPAHERLFAEHYVTDPGLPVPMSSGDDEAFHDAMVAFKLGEHDEARSKWMDLLRAAPDNDTLRYYIAQAALAQGDVVGAVPLLGQVAADTTSEFSGKARWYLFLAHLKRGDREAMRALRLEDDVHFGERARAILASLDP
ncbi:MAG: hypothetical protein KIT10_13510 [Flavobacteriales bacterium]|nr:hypothetical protein [Flavobacteriales bacterium]